MTVARVAEMPVTGVAGQPTEVRIVVAVVEIESAIVAFRAAPDLATRAPLAAALVEAVRALAVAGARPAWARAGAAVDEGGSHHEEEAIQHRTNSMKQLPAPFSFCLVAVLTCCLAVPFNAQTQATPQVPPSAAPASGHLIPLRRQRKH